MEPLYKKYRVNEVLNTIVGNKYFVDKAGIYAKFFFSKFIIQMNGLVFSLKASIKGIKGMKIEAT